MMSASYSGALVDDLILDNDSLDTDMHLQQAAQPQ